VVDPLVSEPVAPVAAAYTVAVAVGHKPLEVVPVVVAVHIEVVEVDQIALAAVPAVEVVVGIPLEVALVGVAWAVHIAAVERIEPVPEAVVVGHIGPVAVEAAGHIGLVEVDHIALAVPVAVAVHILSSVVAAAAALGAVHIAVASVAVPAAHIAPAVAHIGPVEGVPAAHRSPAVVAVGIDPDSVGSELGSAGFVAVVVGFVVAEPANFVRDT